MMRQVALLLGLAVAAASPGDGRMFASQATPGLVEAPPSISSQRAVLKFDGREQTMIVESVLSGPRGRYGWVVPLPKRPSFVKAVKPQYIQGTFAAVKPAVRPLEKRPLPIPLAVSLFGMTLLLTAGLRYRHIDTGMRVLAFAGESAAVLVALTLAFGQGAPGEADAAAGGYEMRATKSAVAPGGVEVESLGTIGSYEVSVLSGETGRPLLDWLKTHDIQVPEDALDVIDRYAKEGWCFLAAEFRKEEARPLPPHPLKAVFPTDRLIYPMRLTGTQDAPLRLELVVVADRRAEIDGMRAWTCHNDDLLVSVPRDRQHDEDVYADWQGSLYAMAKDGAVVTYLRGDMSPAQMREDYTVDWKPYERYQVEVRDRDQARAHALRLAAMWLPLGAGLFGLLGVLLPSVATRAMAAGAIASFVIASSIGGAWYGSVEKVDTKESGGYYHRPYYGH